MNIFQKVVLLFKVKSVGETIIKEARMPTLSGKPGWKTTEFWGKLGVQVMTLWGAVSGFVPPKYAVVISASLEAIYQITRTVSKGVADIKTAQAGSTVVTTTAPVTTVTTPA